MQLPFVVSLLVCSAMASTVKDPLENEQLKEPEANGRSLARLYSLSTDSFRLSLGLADECTQVIFCKNNYVSNAPPAAATAASGNLPAVSDNKYNQDMCKERMVFNLLTNTVVYNGQTKYLVSSVADFILDHKSEKHVLKVLKDDQLKTSDLRDGAKPELVEERWELDLKTWNKVSLLASGFDCTAHLETFKRSSSSSVRQEALTNSDLFIKSVAQEKNNSLPFFMPLGKEDASLTESCHESFMKGSISNMGEYVKNEKSQPIQFEYTLEQSTVANSTENALQLEIQEPQNCEFIRLCFDNDCNIPKKILDLDFYHRYYHPIDSQRARPFQVRPNELDTFIFEFHDKKMVFKYGSVASRSRINWISHAMASGIGIPKKVQLIVGKCPGFRLGRANSVNLTPAQKSTLRSKLHVVDCKHTK